MTDVCNSIIHGIGRRLSPTRNSTFHIAAYIKLQGRETSAHKSIWPERASATYIFHDNKLHYFAGFNQLGIGSFPVVKDLSI